MESEEATPKAIPSFNGSQPKEWLDHLYKKIRNRTPVSHWNGNPIYRIGDKQNQYIVLVVDGDIAYFVSAKEVKVGGSRFGRQVLVWRNTDEPASAYFAQNVLFGVLLPEYKTVVTDTQQTPNGRQFWTYAITKALQQNKALVYYLDKRIRPIQYQPITSLAEFSLLAKKAWGTDRLHEDRLFILSTVPLE